MFDVKCACEEIRRRCEEYKGNDVLELACSAMTDGVVRFHGPEHHYLTAASICSVWCNALGEEKRPHLERLELRCNKIPPAVCGYYGVCGDSMAAGAAASEMLGANYLSGESWRQVNELTSVTQSAIAASCTRGPRCCKRTTFAVVIAAAEWMHERLGIDAALTNDFKCPLYTRNNQCIGMSCSFFPQDSRI